MTKWPACIAVALLACNASKSLTNGPGYKASNPLSQHVAKAFGLTEAQLVAERTQYLTSVSARRSALEKSLVNPANSYSQHRLGYYAVDDSGWELLPEWNPKAATVVLGQPVPSFDNQAPLWDERTPQTDQEWIELGRNVFFYYPLRSEFSLEHLLEGTDRDHQAKRADIAQLGIAIAPDGSLPGVVAFDDIEDGTRIGITCAICHSTVESGQIVVGRARRKLDFGAMRLKYYRDTQTELDPNLERRMMSWGPGRADVTEDDDEDPVVIPDLWALAEQSHLTQAGTIRQFGPVALAIRQETQLTHANLQRIRPPRVLAWALAMYLYSLTPPAQAEAERGHDNRDELLRGKQLFKANCKRCHASAAYSGRPIATAQIGTNPALANSRGRGTRTYRVPALIRVAGGAPYFHDGSIATLEELLSGDRFAPEYSTGRLGPCPVPGHRYGIDLSAAEKQALIAFLRTL